MSVGFGFSIGDMITAIGLIKTSIEAVRDSKAAPEEYQLLAAELESLEAGLVAINKLPSYILSQDIAVKSTIRNCSRCLEDFRKELAKYRSSLGSAAGGFRTYVRRIQWALCKKDDIMNFRSQIAGHALSINMLLTTLGVQQTLNVQQAQKNCSAAISETWNATVEISRSTVASQGMLESLAMMLPRIMESQNNLTTSFQPRGAMSEHQLLLLENTLPQLLKEILDLQSSIQLERELPPQVRLSKPVILSDACGKVAPFHLDFITSADIFLTVLKARFRDSGVTEKGLEKLDKSEFVFRDRHRYLSLTAPWQRVFKPGQDVEMSMIFYRPRPNICPACRQFFGLSWECRDQDLTCYKFWADSISTKCGLEVSCVVKEYPAEPISSHAGIDMNDKITESSTEETLLLEAAELEDFRRVRVEPIRVPENKSFTRIDRQLISVRALAENNEEFEVQDLHVVVFRSMTSDELVDYEKRTRQVRGQRPWPRCVGACPGCEAYDALHGYSYNVTGKSGADLKDIQEELLANPDRRFREI